MKNNGKCPLCKKTYTGQNFKTGHHLFPQKWFSGGPKLPVCHECHQKEFNVLYPMTTLWTKRECIDKWIKFCLSKIKGKNIYKIYPELIEVCG